MRSAATGLIGLAAAWRGLRFAGSSLKAFADFETSLARVSTMLDDQTAHFLPEYEKQIAKLAIRYGQTTKALAKGTFDIISGSFEAADAMEFLETATRSAIGGFTDVATSVKALVAILNAYGMSASEAGRVTGVMAAIVKKGVIEYEELANTIGQVVPIAAASGLSLEELAAAIATITQKGVSARMTMTALKAIITTFLAPTPEAVKAAKEFDLKLNATTLSTLGLTGALQKLSNASAEDTAAIFSNVRALLGVEATRNTITKLIENHQTALNSLTLSESNYQKAVNTTNIQLAKNRELWLSVKRELGAGIAPEVGLWLDGMSTLVANWKSNWAEIVAIQKSAAAEITDTFDGIRNAWRFVSFSSEGDVGVARSLEETKNVARDLKLALADIEKSLQKLDRGLGKNSEKTKHWSEIEQEAEDLMRGKFTVVSKATEAQRDAADAILDMVKILQLERELIGKSNDEREEIIKLRELEALTTTLGVSATSNIISVYKDELRINRERRKEAAKGSITAKYFGALDKERMLLGLTSDERERAIELQRFENELKAAGVEVTKELTDAYIEQLQANQKLSRQAEKDEAFAREFEEDRRNILRGPLIAMLEDRELEEVFKAGLARLGTTIVEHMYEKTIVEPLMDILEDTIDPAMEKIADKMMDHLSELADNVASLLSTIFGGIINVVGGAIGGGIGGLLGGGAAAGGAAGSITGSGISGISLPAAHGAVFNNANVTPFARGGILDGPTVFPMANGGLALGGEAGHEALMPLKRDSSGRLGVTSADGGESGGTSIKIINVLDDSMFSEYLSTGDGEREIVNIMRRNASEVTGI